MKYKQKKGFTLAEIIVGITVFSLLSVGVYQFMSLSMQGLHKSGQTLHASNDVRGCFDNFQQDAMKASYAVLYDDYAGDFRTSQDPMSNFRLDAGSAGNFVLLVYNGIDADIYDAQPAPIDKIIGYYLDNSDPLNHKIRRFEKQLNAAYVGQDIEGFLPPTTEIAQHHRELDSIKGVMDDMAFYKVKHNAIMLGIRTKTGSGSHQYSRMLNSTFTISSN